ncbi:uncharacterized protein F5147DRAFT_653929 [Suillus discolor]|uniref:Uncharacterized protein n=1 Tax=Suillus discolor TaxID=1912936 RepID=A0A9P7F4V6_9AGAM|nr:uncharacterized protein F5147DRAFT_653929 [Suillus discolor]KAG2106173.1 hypothetical protein F5147DRAFT_653929 [Suillus discolor]
MSTTDIPRRTRPSNATARPGQIVLNAQVKRHTKAQKNADDLAAKEAKELKEAQVEEGLKRLAGMQNEMEKAQEELLTMKAIPIRPKPRAHKAMKPAVRTSDNHTDSMMEAEADDLQETVEQMDDGNARVTKKTVTKKGGKTLVKDAISNLMQKKINEPSSKGEGDITDGMARVSDGKDSVSLNAASQKFALGGRVTNWVSDIKPQGKPEHPKLAPTSSVTRAPLTPIFTQGTASTVATSDAQVPTQKPAVPAEILGADDALIGSFADAINDALEREAAIVQGKGKLKVASIFEDISDFEAKATSTQVLSRAHDSDDNSVASSAEQEQYSLETKPPFTQVDPSQTLKRKTVLDDTLDDDEVSDWSMDVDGPAFEDLVMISDEDSQPKPVVLKKNKVQCTTSLTSVSVASAADSKPPALKKAKIESSLIRARNTPAIERPLNVDTAPDRMKPHSAYCNVDLPAMMQVDQRWTKKYLPTVMLWAGSYEDIWTIPDDVLLLHAQLILNAVYKELNITIVHGGVIHSLTAQRISEWRSNFGSTGIVIILDFLTRNSDCDPVELAESLVTSYTFLFENPDDPNPLTVYRSPFVLQLLGTAHLNAINGYVEVPKLDMHALAMRGMSGVISLSAAAIERALNMFAKKHLKVKEVLAAGSGKLTIKLPKVLNKATGKMTNTPFLFSEARWTKATKSFTKSLSKKPAGYIEMTIQMARACTALNDATDTPQGSFDEEESDDERAMLLILPHFMKDLCRFTCFLKQNKC